MSNKGYVYIIRDTEQDNLLKIGFTKGDVHKRAKQLSTGAAGLLVVEWYILVPDCKVAERMIHHNLREYRFNKEFFSVDLFIAINVCLSTAKSLFMMDKFEVYSRKKSDISELDLLIAQLKTELEKDPRNRMPKEETKGLGS